MLHQVRVLYRLLYSVKYKEKTFYTQSERITWKRVQDVSQVLKRIISFSFSCYVENI